MPWVAEGGRRVYRLTAKQYSYIATVMRASKDEELKELLNTLLNVLKDIDVARWDISTKDHEIQRLTAENEFMLRLIDRHCIGENEA